MCIKHSKHFMNSLRIQKRKIWSYMLLEVDNLAENYIQPWKLIPQESYSRQSYYVQKVEQNVHQHSCSSFQLMMKIEIANYIHRCIILINDTHLFHKEFINGLPFHVQSTFASIDHLDNHYELIQIVNIPTMLKLFSILF